jgi:hypothetical protein
MHARVAFFFKEAHRFEQRQRGVNRAFWQSLPVRWLVVSLPAASLTGRHDKSDQHRRLVYNTIAGLPWQVIEEQIGEEMVFIIQREERAESKRTVRSSDPRSNCSSSRCSLHHFLILTAHLISAYCSLYAYAQKTPLDPTPSNRRRCDCRSAGALPPAAGRRRIRQLVAELERPLYTAIRINPLKVDPQPALSGWIERYGWTVQPVPYCQHGYWITAARVSPSQTIEHRLGYYYIQDAASMLPVELFDFSGPDAPLMLDMAASPGGKTTHMIARSGDRGLVIANDSSPSRINALRLVLEQWGAVSPAVTRFPG